MKKSFKGFLACLLALIMVIPMFTVANADQMSTFNGHPSGPRNRFR